ncbi:MAG TPA: hypothetical protein VMU05_16730 [Dongiaceae bacterium]|nr:hypothetical protein [Dongiaceae bacterium]
MQKIGLHLIALVLMAAPLFAQGKRLWVLRPTGEMVEYDPATFAPKQNVKLPPEALRSPANISVNSAGQILFAAPVSLPVPDSDAGTRKAWLWDGHAGSWIDEPIERKTEEHGSNQAVNESAAVPILSADGKHLFWFASQARRLQREEMDLSITGGFEAWQTGLEGKAREDVASAKLPECRCTSGTCEETCPTFQAWSPEGGVRGFLLVNQTVSGQTATTYKASTRYEFAGGKWTSNALPEPLQRVLDANATGSVIVEAIPDTGCCGWSNQSNDQTLVVAEGKKLTIFDEQASYKNPDYDVSFYTVNARLSADATRVAMTIIATAQSNKPIQLAEEGQANPEESQRIRKALLTLPAVEVKSVDETTRRIALVPRAALVGWISDHELLIMENHLLVAYNVATGARRKSMIRVEDGAHVFLP